MTTTTVQTACTFDKSESHYASLCGLESTFAIVNPQSELDYATMVEKYGAEWQEKGVEEAPREFRLWTTYAPRCNRHAAAFRKSWAYYETTSPTSSFNGGSNLVPLNDEIVAILATAKAERAAAKAIELDKKQTANEEAAARRTVEEQKTTKTIFRSIREDEQGGFDWEASKTTKSEVHLPDVPKWIVITKERKAEVDKFNAGEGKEKGVTERYSRFSESSVMFANRYGERRLEVRVSSVITVNEAKALIDALHAAVEEASK